MNDGIQGLMIPDFKMDESQNSSTSIDIIDFFNILR